MTGNGIYLRLYNSTREITAGKASMGKKVARSHHYSRALKGALLYRRGGTRGCMPEMMIQCQQYAYMMLASF